MFTDSKVGRKEGWSREGRKLYTYLLKEVNVRRKCTDSMHLEQCLLQEFKNERGESDDDKHRQKKRDQESEDEWDPMEGMDTESETYKVVMGILD